MFLQFVLSVAIPDEFEQVENWKGYDEKVVENFKYKILDNNDDDDDTNDIILKNPIK